MCKTTITGTFGNRRRKDVYTIMNLERIKELAEEGRESFITHERGEKTIWTLKDEARYEGSPVMDLVLAVHQDGETSPDDYRYEWTLDSLIMIAEAIDEGDDPEEREYEIEPDIYTADLMRWIGSRADRYSYCDEALSEYGADYFAGKGGVIDIIQAGQTAEKREVYRAVLDFLVEQTAEESES